MNAGKQFAQLEARAAVLNEQIKSLADELEVVEQQIHEIKYNAFCREYGVVTDELLRVTEELLAFLRKRGERMGFDEDAIQEWRSAKTVRFKGLEQRGEEVFGRLANERYGTGTGGIPIAIIQGMKQA